MSDLVDPALFLEWLYWAKPYLTDGEREIVRRLRRGAQKRLGLDFIDRVMTRTGAADQMQVFYPSDELTCAHGHPWAENAVTYGNGRRRCRTCYNADQYSQRLRRGPQLRLF